MSGWQNSDRGDRLPPEWRTKIRPRILRRAGHRCQVTNTYGERCPELAAEVDHIRAGDDHSDDNLRAICEWHHGKKSGAEGAAALAAKRRRISKKYRRTEVHPGLM